MTLIDDRRVVVAVGDARIALADDAASAGDEGLFLTGRQQDVIRRDARLAGVQALADDDALDGTREMRR